MDDPDRCPICGADLVGPTADPLSGYDPLYGLDDEDVVGDLDPGRAPAWERGPSGDACLGGHTAEEIAAARRDRRGQDA